MSLSILTEKIYSDRRLSLEEALFLYEAAPLSDLAVLANYRREQLNGKKVFFNRNFHLEPTNICINDCVFCSYRRNAGEEGSWDYSLEEILAECRRQAGTGITEVHIVGGVHLDRDVRYYAELLMSVKEVLPDVCIKAFTAIEIDYMIRKANISLHDGLLLLQRSGLTAIPGGGAEILDDEIRQQICPKKGSSEVWLKVHETAHKLGIRTNATMLFGHIETPLQRIRHLIKLRDLQDLTGGFDAFVPLKYKSLNNALGKIGEAPAMEVLRTMALSRLVLDNIPHIKAYWPMLGKELMQMSLLFGADDIDGTINDSTKIYSMAGADKHPVLTDDELRRLVYDAGFIPVERDTLYNEIFL